MVLKETKKSEIFGAAGFAHTEFKIDTSNVGVIMNLLSKGFYQNPRTAIVQEYCSNSWDSHVEAGCEDKAIIVKFSKQEKDYFIEFIDYGVGLSPERIKEVFTVYFSSTKRETDDFIGAIGLGSKSAYSYTDSFFVITRYEGIEYTYLMSKDDYGKSRLTLLVSNETEEENGTIIKIKLKDTSNRLYQYSYREDDIDKFYKACVSKLAYFNNVYIEGGSIIDATEFNSAKIHHFNTFCYSEAEPLKEMHIRFGQCTYQIPWSDLGLNRNTTPVAVKFDIGELMPTPNREGITLDDTTRKLIIERINTTWEEILDLYNQQNQPYEDWLEWYKMTTRYNTTPFIKIGEKEVEIDHIRATGFKHTLKDLSVQVHHNDFLAHWYYARKLKSGLRESNLIFRPKDIEDRVIYTITGDYNKYKNRYLEEVTHSGRTVLLLKAKKLYLKDYRRILSLRKLPKDQWRKVIIEFQTVLKKIWKNLPSYDEIVVPKEWIKSTYKKKVSRDLSGKVILHHARLPERTTDYYSTYDKDTVEISKLSKSRCFFIYGYKEDREQLDHIFKLTKKYKKVKVVMTAQNNGKHLEELDNFVHVGMIDKEYNKYFAKTVTAYMLDTFMSHNKFFFNNIQYIKKLNTSIGETMEKINNYVENYSPLKTHSYYGNQHPIDFYKSAWEIARTNKFYDHTMVANYREVWNFIDKAGDLELLKTDRYGQLDEATMKVAILILKNKIILNTTKLLTNEVNDN